MRIERQAALVVLGALIAALPALAAGAAGGGPALGLPPVPVPAHNPQTEAKVALGKKLFHDKRFSSTGEVACANCHDATRAFTDSPLAVSEGIRKLNGTRNAPTVINAAYMKTQFWDGRSPDLEDQALHPFLNPVEMGLKNHDPILKLARTDKDYAAAFQEVFGKSGDAITMKEVTQAIAAFERTIVAGNSPFDRWHFGGEANALNESQKRGFDLFVNKGRCVSCHRVEQTQAVFTDGRFHNVGVGINQVQDQVPGLAKEFLKAQATLAEVDVKVLGDKRTSELGRFAVSRGFDDLGSFKTPTLRNIAVTAPYMHDGSLKTLREVIVHYNNGGVTKAGERVNDFLSGGIRPLELTDPEIDDLVAFMEALTSPEFAPAPAAAAAGK
jgi:cytochrome c peroxidase